MKNLNIFRRLDELETANMHLQVMLKSTRLELTALREGLAILHSAVRLKPRATPKPEPKVKTTKQILKQQEYSRKYYLKKKAKKLAAMGAT
jgi:hypothetical protein